MTVTKLGNKNFEEEVLKSKIPVLVDFYAEWCGPCKIIAPIIDELAVEYKDRIKFCKLDIEEMASIANKYSVMSVPTLMLFLEGLNIDIIIGAVNKEKIKEMLEEFL
jgi:thioredoxin 1